MIILAFQLALEELTPTKRSLLGHLSTTIGLGRRERADVPVIVSGTRKSRGYRRSILFSFLTIRERKDMLQ